MQNRYRANISPLLKLQLIIALGFSLVVLFVSKNLRDVASTGAGGLIAVIPTWGYIKIALRDKFLVGYPAQVLKRHKQAMLVKFLLSILLFALCAIFFRACNFLLLFTTYICVILGAYMLALINFNFSK